MAILSRGISKKVTEAGFDSVAARAGTDNTKTITAISRNGMETTAMEAIKTKSRMGRGNIFRQIHLTFVDQWSG